MELKKENHTKQPSITKEIIAIIVTVIFLIVYFLVLHPMITAKRKPPSYQKEESIEEEIEEEEIQEEQEEKPSLVIANSKRIGLFDQNFNLIWDYKLENGTIVSNDISRDDNYIYFLEQENNQLKRINIKTKEIENIDVNLKDVVNLHVIGNRLVYNNENDIEIINLDDKTKKHIDHSTYSFSFVKDYVFYTRKDLKDLISYSLKNDDRKIIDKKGKVISYNKNYVLYLDHENKYYLYDVEKDKKTYILKGGKKELKVDEQETNTFHLYKNKVYYLTSDTLYTVKENKKTKIYKFSLEDNESIVRIVWLDNNRLVASKLIQLRSQKKYKNVLINIKENKTEEIGYETWISEPTYEIQYIN